MIPTDFTGRIIGRKGKKIKHICRQSRAAKINIDTKTVYIKNLE